MFFSCETHACDNPQWPRTMAAPQEAVPVVTGDDWFPHIVPRHDMMSMPAWNWHGGMPHVTPHADLMHDLFVDALQSYVKTTKELIAAKKFELERAGHKCLLDDSDAKRTVAAPATDPPTDSPPFSAQESLHPAPPQHSPSVETPIRATGGRMQSLSCEEARGDIVLKPVLNSALANLQSDNADSAIPTLTLKKSQHQRWYMEQ